MRVGICTIYDPGNYGNRLQRYAIQILLEDMGCEVVEIVYATKRWLWWLRDSGVGFAIRRIKGRGAGAPLRYLESQRFARSSGRTRYVDDRSVARLSGEFDYFIAGSDQVWNPDLPFGARTDGYQCLAFARPEQKIALAPSFGVLEIRAPWRERYSVWLNDFSALSAREETGQSIIKELTGKESTLLVDPTLAVTAERWRRVEREPRWAVRPYVLVYRLGPEDVAHDSLIQEKAAELGAEVVRLLDSRDEQASVVGPREFLGLIDGAEHVFTDSFHASAFCLQFHTPFTVWRRASVGSPGMWSRIEGLARTCQLEEAVFGGELAFTSPREWAACDAALDLEREVFDSYMHRHLRCRAGETES